MENVTLVKSLLNDILNVVCQEKRQQFRKRKHGVVRDSHLDLDTNTFLPINTTNNFLTSTPIDFGRKTAESESRQRDHSEYLQLRSDYSHRPRIEGLDWANLSWTDPDQCWPPDSDQNKKQ